MEKCSVCSCEFSLDEEGGISGEFGVLPVDFCPTCFSSMMDMADKLGGNDMTLGWGNSRVATKYMYQRIHDILDEVDGDIYNKLSRLMDELAVNYYEDTGEKMGAENESND